MAVQDQYHSDGKSKEHNMSETNDNSSIKVIAENVSQSTNNDAKLNDEPYIPFSYRFGYRSYRPNCLQMFNTPRWLLFSLCFYAMCIFMQLGFRGATIPQLEKRYNMTSTNLGTIMTVNDVAGALIAVWLTYFAGQRQKGKWIGYGVISFGLGSIVFSLPHFIVGRYYYTQSIINTASNVSNDVRVCHLNSLNHLTSAANCTNLGATTTQTPWIYTMLFVIGQIFTGIGIVTHYTMSLAYMDENVSPTSSPLYIGIFHMVGLLGSCFGFLFSGFLSALYVDTPTVPKDLAPNDPRWIGAWWLGYLLVGIIAILTSSVVFAFPGHLPTYEKSRMKRMAQANNVKTATKNEYSNTLANFPKAFYTVISNPVFLLAALGIAVDDIFASGMATFLPKYLQSQSGWSLLVTVTVTGTCIVISAAIGQILGGGFIKRWNLTGSRVSRFCFIVSVINVILSCTFLMYCENSPVAGVNVNYNSRPTNTGSPYNSQPTRSGNNTMFLATCNSNCGCRTDSFEPVCGIDGLSYISPCLAGCRSISKNRTSTLASTNYFNCSCINSAAGGVARKGMCPLPSCNMPYPLIVGLVFLVITTSVSFSPSISIMLRSIPESRGPFGMGIYGMIYRLVGRLIGPILFGFLLDGACSIWNERCDVRQFCWQYDNRNLALYVFMATAIIKSVKVVIYALLWYFHKKEEESMTKQAADDQQKDPAVQGDGKRSFAEGNITNGQDERHKSNGILLESTV